MEILNDVLKDSKAHYLDVEAKILNRLKILPRGSLLKRRLPRGGHYYYLNYRDGSRVISKYIGKKEPPRLIKEIEERRLLLKRLKDVRSSLAVLKRLRWEKPRAKRHC